MPRGLHKSPYRLRSIGLATARCDEFRFDAGSAGRESAQLQVPVGAGGPIDLSFRRQSRNGVNAQSASRLAGRYGVLPSHAG